MVLGYYRLGKFEDARRSMQRLLTFAERFRMDNPLTRCGSEVYQPNQPINLCYDTFGPAAAFMRGLFEYLYRADDLTLVPHVPPSITELEQLDPVRFGTKQILLSTVGSGPITAVKVNGRKWRQFDRTSVFLPYGKTPDLAHVQIVMGNVKTPFRLESRQAPRGVPVKVDRAVMTPDLAVLDRRAARLRHFEHRLNAADLGRSYEAAHARLAAECVEILRLRRHLLDAGTIKPLPGPGQGAANTAFLETATKLCDGLERVLKSYEVSNDQARNQILELWAETSPNR